MFIRLTSNDTEKPHDLLIYWRAVQEIEKVTMFTIVRTTVKEHYVKELPNEILGLIESARDFELRDAAQSRTVCPA